MAKNLVIRKLLEQSRVGAATSVETDGQQRFRAMLRKEFEILLEGLPGLRKEICVLEKGIAESVKLRDDLEKMVEEVEEIFIANETGTASEVETLVDAFAQRHRAA